MHPFLRPMCSGKRDAAARVKTLKREKFIFSIDFRINPSADHVALWLSANELSGRGVTIH